MSVTNYLYNTYGNLFHYTGLSYGPLHRSSFHRQQAADWCRFLLKSVFHLHTSHCTSCIPTNQNNLRRQLQYRKNSVFFNGKKLKTIFWCFGLIQFFSFYASFFQLCLLFLQSNCFFSVFAVHEYTTMLNECWTQSSGKEKKDNHFHSVKIKQTKIN